MSARDRIRAVAETLREPRSVTHQNRPQLRNLVEMHRPEESPDAWPDPVYNVGSNDINYQIDEIAEVVRDLARRFTGETVGSGLSPNTTDGNT